jgi:hypothetical protein
MRFVALALAFVLLTAFSTMDEIDALVRAGQLEEGFRLSEQKAAAGDHEGEEALAWFYDEGKFVAEDDARAAFYFRKAAEAGLRHSQWRLGVMLDLGEGVPADPAEALSWFEKSAAQNYAKAWTSLGVMHAEGRGTRQDFARARAYYLQAGKAGEPHGFYGIGILYMLGQGVPQDNVEGFVWLAIADINGDSQARAPMRAAAAMLKKSDIKRAARRMEAITNELGLRPPPNPAEQHPET